MTPAARFSSAISLLEAIFSTPQQPADKIAHAWFLARRYAGAKDRASILTLVWTILKHFFRLNWWIQKSPLASSIGPSARILVGTYFLLTGGTLEELKDLFSGAQFAEHKLSSHEEAAFAFFFTP